MVDDDPIAWKEREVEGLALFGFARHLPAWPLHILFGVSTVALYLWLDQMAFGLCFFIPFALVTLVAVRTSGTVCRERDRQTWDLLLLTPLDTGELLNSKRRGVLQAVRPYIIAYVSAGGLAIACGEYVPGIVAIVYMLLLGCHVLHRCGGHHVRATARVEKSARALANGYLSVFALQTGWSLAFGAVLALHLYLRASRFTAAYDTGVAIPLFAIALLASM